MILPDVNLLLYAHNELDERFESASRWFENLMSGNTTVCFCWETIDGFIRISTNPRGTKTPIKLNEAFTVVAEWLRAPNTVILQQTDRHFEILEKIAIDADTRGPLFSDASLAALAISHNATIASSNRHFRLFESLKLINPLDIPVR